MIDLPKVWDQAMIENTTHVFVVVQAYDLRPVKNEVMSRGKNCQNALCTFSSLVLSLILISKEHICIRRFVQMLIVQLFA